MKQGLIILFCWAASALGQSPAGTFTATGAMATARSRHTATLLNNGKVLIAGGELDFSFSATASAELYDPASGTFTPTGSMSTPRILHSGSLLPDGRVLITGGDTGSENILHAITAAEVYDPSTGTFTTTSDMIHGRECAKAIELNNGKVLLSGGPALPPRFRMRNSTIPRQVCSLRLAHTPQTRRTFTSLAPGPPRLYCRTAGF